MAIFGIGTDIVEVSRIESLIFHYGDRLAKRILTDIERSQYKISQKPILFMAKCFAIKESAAKAFGTGFRQGLAFCHFEIHHDELGKPLLFLHGKAKLLADHYKIKTIHLSVADERHYVCASVVMEKYHSNR